MEKKYLKNSIISFVLILSTVLSPLSFIPKKAEAQSVGGYASGLGGAILQLPQCNIIGGTMDAIFGSADLLSLETDSTGYTKKIFDDGSVIESWEGEAADKLLEDAATTAANQFTGVEVYVGDSTTRTLKRIDTNTSATKKATESLNENSTCIQSIGRLIIKMLLQKLTVSTINWINSGFDGQPAFIQDPGKFFSDIAKNEVLQFGLEINDPELFPFGKAWMRNTAEAFNSKFQDNARYSLDRLIQNTNPEYSALTFYQDFSQGGWNAWTAMTQAPQNNPLGFQLMADNEIQRRLEGTTQSTAEYVHDALQAANGFLGDQRCVSALDGTINLSITRAQYEEYLRKTPPQVLCSSWTYVTPGSLVASAATTAMGYQNNAYLNVEDLNDAVAAILDALLGQFSSTIMEKGFANYGDAGSDGKLFFNSGSTDRYETQTQKDFIPSQLTNSWLSANPNFNIRTDLTQALIDEQRTYADKLTLQNKELLSTTDGKPYTINDKGISNSYGLIPVIDQLDYCIPGPHPGWEQDAQKALNAAMSVVTPETQQSLEDVDMENVIGIARAVIPLAGAAVGGTVIAGWLVGAGLGATLGSAVPVVGTIIGAIVGTLFSFLLSDGSDSGKVRAYYANILMGFTGQLPDYREEESMSLNLTSKSGATNVLNGILDRYSNIIDKIYNSNPEYLPTITKESTSVYNQLKGYGQMMKNNDDKIFSLKNTVNVLGEIKDAVTKLNTDYPNGGDEYESKLKAQINAFGRVSASMVNGADIANADSLYKQIIDKKNYIYKNLLKGPYGCEAEIQAKSKRIAELEAKAKNEEEKAELASLKFPYPWQGYDINSVKRMTYPFPILYDYNILTAGTDIPDPWNSGYITPNKMPTQNGYGSYGPGFLSFIVFSNDTANRQGPERLPIHDLLPLDQYVDGINNRDVPLGAPRGPFETIIGIY